MPTNNFKLFDENKVNILTDTEYNTSSQRLNGVQTGVASSQLNNKFAYQVSLVAYAIAQIMNANGQDASDTLAVSAFVGNLQGTLLQKVADKATTAEAAAGVISNKYITPETMKAAALLLSGGVMSGMLDMGGNRITNLGTPTADSDAITKAYADSKYGRKILVSSTPISINSSGGTSEYLQKFDLNLSEELFLNDPDAVGFEIVFNSDFNIKVKERARIFNISVIVSDKYTSSGIKFFSGVATVDGGAVYAVNGKRIFRSIEFMPTADGEYYVDWNRYNDIYVVLAAFDSNKITNGNKIRVWLENASVGTYTFNANFTVNIYKLYY